MLALRPATVVHAHEPLEAGHGGGVSAAGQRLTVELQGDGRGARREAMADTRLVGHAEAGDQVIVSLLDAGGEDAAAGGCLVHANLSRGLGARPPARGGWAKLAGTSLAHAVAAVDERAVRAPLGRPVAVLEMDGHLPALAWAFARACPGRRLGYIQCDGGTLGSAAVPLLRGGGLLAGHITAGAGFGGELEARSVAGAVRHGLAELGWDAAVCGPGAEADDPSAGAAGATAALDSAHAALALGCPTLLVASMATGAGRAAYRALSERTLTVLDLLLAPVTVALPAGMRSPVGADLRASLGNVFGNGERRTDAEHELDRPVRITRHDWRRAAVDLPAFAASGVDPRAAGSGITDEPLFFASALAGGAALAELVDAGGLEGEGEAA
jgi:hypothetical protein